MHPFLIIAFPSIVQRLADLCEHEMLELLMFVGKYIRAPFYIAGSLRKREKNEKNPRHAVEPKLHFLGSPLLYLLASSSALRSGLTFTVTHCENCPLERKAFLQAGVG